MIEVEVHPVGAAAELNRLRELERRVADENMAREICGTYATMGRAGACTASGAYRAWLLEGLSAPESEEVTP